MTEAQYRAILEVAENGERFPTYELNIRPATAAAIAKRGWISVLGNRAFVTPKGWEALS